MAACIQADSQPKSSGLVLGRRPLGAILHSSNEPGELLQWLCRDDSTINIVVLIIIIIIINYSATSNSMNLVHWPLMGGLLHLLQRDPSSLYQNVAARYTNHRTAV